MILLFSARDGGEIEGERGSSSSSIVVVSTSNYFKENLFQTIMCDFKTAFRNLACM
jgi:hypothetical protein